MSERKNEVRGSPRTAVSMSPRLLTLSQPHHLTTVTDVTELLFDYGDGIALLQQSFPQQSFPQQLAHIEHQLDIDLLQFLSGLARHAHLARENANRIVEPFVLLVIADVPRCANDLAASRWIRATIALVIEHDRRAVVSLDDSLEVHRECSVGAPPWMVRTPKAACDKTGALTFRYEEMLLFRAARSNQLNFPVFGIDKANLVQRLQLQATICP